MTREELEEALADELERLIETQPYTPYPLQALARAAIRVVVEACATAAAEVPEVEDEGYGQGVEAARSAVEALLPQEKP